MNLSVLFPCSIFLHYISNQLLCQNSHAVLLPKTVQKAN
ncbi:hypothetical protein SPAR64_0078 [Streptococcus pneumoniae GA40410]|nr:hypothetical protein SPAR64_0078 [Streptococcus pneumoniae GA40410]